MSITLIRTSDGSHSLLNTELNETYHSVHGAIQESRHVFVQNGFDFFCTQSTAEPVRIFEVGFGTGLNALLTYQRARSCRRAVHYTAIESNPLEQSVWGQLNYGQLAGDHEVFTQMHQFAWGQEESIGSTFTLAKHHATIDSWRSQRFFDLIYFDAFAPGKQPEMWTLNTLKKVTEALDRRGVFVTYCAKGAVKRVLRDLELTVESPPGPPGKREMIRAYRPLRSS